MPGPGRGSESDNLIMNLLVFSPTTCKHMYPLPFLYRVYSANPVSERRTTMTRTLQMVLLLAACILAPLSTANASVRVQVIDRGQADGILIRTPNHKWIVIDAGTNKQQAESMESVWGVNEVALAIVSHRHSDHQNGMDDILKKFDTVERFLGILENCPNRTGDDNVRNAIKASTTRLALDTPPITIDDVTFTVLPLPPRSECPDHENSNSVVVRMDHGEFSMLFTGDAEEDELDFLADNHASLLDVDVLKASHHGSKNGYTDKFLEKVSPEIVVISAGVNGNHKHPNKEAVDAYAAIVGDKLHCTNRHMTVRVYGYEDGHARVFRQNKIDKSCIYDGTHY